MQMSGADGQLGEALAKWGAGENQAAIALVRPLAEADDPAALHLISWFFAQLGEPQWREGVVYAKKAALKGNPWAAGYLLPYMVGDPAFRAEAVELISNSPTLGFPQIDPVGQAVNFQASGDPTNAVAILRSGAGPWAWHENAPELRERIMQIDQLAASVAVKRDEVFESFDSTQAQLEEHRNHFNTRSKTLTELLDNLTNASAQQFFEDEAKKYETESTTLWVIGVFVLALAAAAAVLPLILNYVDSGHALHGQTNVSAHLGATLAFAAVAGVLLARARSRDRSRQRARDLSVALGTMFAYSEQIADDAEKQQFKHDMGRLILESFLRQEASPADEGTRSVLGAITDRGALQPQTEA